MREFDDNDLEECCECPCWPSGWCCKDKCFGYDLAGVLCSLISWVALIGCSYTVLNVLEGVSIVAKAIYGWLVISAMVAHIQAQRTSPGYVPCGTGKAQWTEASKKYYDKIRAELELRRMQALEENQNDNQTLEEVYEDGVLVQKLVPVEHISIDSEREIAWKCKRAVERYRKKVKYCLICESYKPPSAHHCSTCKRCVQRMDHHCVWINNCVGKDTMRYFVLFLFYVFAASLMSIGLFIYRSYIVLYYPQARVVQHAESPMPLLACIISFLCCAFFAMFVGAMGYEQYEAITTGVPGIDAAQGDFSDEENTVLQGLQKYACANRSVSPLWLVPFPVFSATASVPHPETESKKTE
mmetsp:Transcript_1661/g.3251  ORF Transcript_1661/g.3251 Transcript_1661/m.3251 type:complete len:355 (-) Transcript_1661:1163-2227(-)